MGSMNFGCEREAQGPCWGCCGSQPARKAPSIETSTVTSCERKTEGWKIGWDRTHFEIITFYYFTGRGKGVSTR